MFQLMLAGRLMISFSLMALSAAAPPLLGGFLLFKDPPCSETKTSPVCLKSWDDSLPFAGDVPKSPHRVSLQP